MTIRVKANSSLVQKYLPDLKLEYGYSIIGSSVDKAENLSWVKSIVHTIGKLFSTLDLLPIWQREIITGISEATQYLNETYKDTPYVDGMGINVNVNSFSNGILKRFNFLINKIGTLEKDVVPFFNINNASILTYKKEMYLNSDMLGNSINYLYMSQKYGIKPTITHILFHEFSHATEQINYLTFNKSRNIVAHSIKYISNTLENTTVDNINDNIEKLHPNLQKISQNLVSHMRGIYSEAYADCGSILLQRNFEIRNGTYDIEQMKSFSKSILLERASDQEKISKNYTEPLSDFKYAIMHSIQNIYEKLDKLPNRELTQEEIHQYSNKASNENLFRFILTTMQTEPQMVNLVTCMSAMCFKGDSKTEFHIPIQKENITDGEFYKTWFNEFINLAGKDWYDNLLNIIEINKSNGTPLKNNEICGLGTSPVKMERFLNKQSETGVFYNKNELIQSDLIEIKNPREIFKNIVEQIPRKSSLPIEEKPKVEKNIFLNAIGRIRKDYHNDKKMDDSATLKVK